MWPSQYGAAASVVARSRHRGTGVAGFVARRSAIFGRKLVQLIDQLDQAIEVLVSGSVLARVGTNAAGKDFVLAYVAVVVANRMKA